MGKRKRPDGGRLICHLATYMVDDDGERVKVRPGDDIEEVTGLEFSGEEAVGLIPRIATWQVDEEPGRDSSGQFVATDSDTGEEQVAEFESMDVEGTDGD